MLIDGAVKGIAILIIALIAYSDLVMRNMIAMSDYTTSFYVSSKLFVEHRLSELYPALSDPTLIGTQYDKAAHLMLPGLPATMTAIFPYAPVVALLLAPFASFAPNLALLVFQCACVAALVAVSELLRRSSESRSGRTSPVPGASDASRSDARPSIASSQLAVVPPGGSLFFSFFLLTPVVLTLWIGQVGILFGMLPCAAGYFLLRRGTPYLAGLVWSLTLLKPQFALIPAMVAVVLLCFKRWQLLAGCLTGAAVFLVVNAFALGPGLFQAWLNAMKLTEAVYLAPSSGVARHLAISVPRFAMYLLPYEQVGSFKPLIYAVAALILLCTVAVTCRFATRCKHPDIATDAAIVSGSLLIPLVAPHLFYYDLSIMAVAGAIVFGNTAQAAVTGQWRRLAQLMWVIISVYPFTWTAHKSMYSPLLVLIPLAVTFVLVMRDLWYQPGKQA